VRVTNVKNLFTLGGLFATDDRKAYWDVKRKRLFVEDPSEDREAVRQEVAETIAKGMMPNRPFREVESFVFQVLCSDVTRARNLMSKRSWLISEQSRSLLAEEPTRGDHEERSQPEPHRGEEDQASAPPDTDAHLDYADELARTFDRTNKTQPQPNGASDGPGPVPDPGRRRQKTDRVTFRRSHHAKNAFLTC
jgi:hypothetical protein